MKPKLPILVIIPHGGISVPEEFAGNEALTKFDLFFESDTCANELFSFEDRVAAKIDTGISRLFVDLDREPLMLPPRSADGVIKKETLTGKPVFIENAFPDEIAIANVLKRYYYTFHATLEKILKTGGIKLIIECHTMMAVGPENASDPGKPRPLMTVTTVTRRDGSVRKTLPDELARGLTDCMRKSFAAEDTTAAGRLAVNRPAFHGHILDRYGGRGVPMARLSLSRALFLNDRYFFYDDLRIDELRILELRKKLWAGIERFFRKYF
jgi:formiminoglutamase